jgi:hypothetical protein
LFPSSSPKILIKFLLFPSITHHQNPFVPIKFQSNSFCFNQAPIKFLLFPSISHQYPFVLIKLPKKSHKIPFVPIKNPFVPMSMEDRQVSTGEHEGERWDSRESKQSAKQSAAIRGQARRAATVASRRLRLWRSRKSRFSACQVLWKIACRSASRTTVSLPRFILHVHDPCRMLSLVWLRSTKINSLCSYWLLQFLKVFLVLKCSLK